MNTIYFIQAGENGPVRVAPCTATTLARLQAGNHEPLAVRAIYEGDRDDAARLHRRYAPHYLRGDWFTADILTDLPTNLRAIDYDRDKEHRRLDTLRRKDDEQRSHLMLANLARGNEDARDEAARKLAELARTGEL